MRKSTLACMAGCLCFSGVALAETSSADDDGVNHHVVNDPIVVSQLPPSYTGHSSLPYSSPLFARSLAREDSRRDRRAAARCVVSDGCFPRPRLAVDARAPETIPGDSIRLGEYGPVLLKFTGTRVKMRVRF